MANSIITIVNWTFTVIKCIRDYSYYSYQGYCFVKINPETSGLVATSLKSICYKGKSHCFNTCFHGVWTVLSTHCYFRSVTVIIFCYYWFLLGFPDFLRIGWAYDRNIQYNKDFIVITYVTLHICFHCITTDSTSDYFISLLQSQNSTKLRVGMFVVFQK